jgi:bacterioferritin (cytochrome b1)
MKLSELIEEKMKEIRNLKIKLEKLENEIEKVKGQYPPIWSGNIKELGKFIEDLEKWVKNPQIKRARDLIEELKKQGKDTRSFSSLSEDYLIKNLDALEKVCTLVSKIENDSLKINIAKRVLNEIQEEKYLENLLRTLSEYCDSFKKFEEMKAENEFLKVVKEDQIAFLVNVEDLSLTKIDNAKRTLRKAYGAVELLAGSSISIQAYIETYKNLKSVDKVWNLANSIRELLGVSIQIEKEVGEPFKEILDYLNERKQCMSKNSLEEIYDCLKRNADKINQWKDKIKKVVEEESNKIKILAEFAELQNNIEQILEELKGSLEGFNVDKAYLFYIKLQEIKDKAIKILEGRISENERKIIENMQKADELIDEMGDSFWEGIKSLRNKRLIKIIVEKRKL